MNLFVAAGFIAKLMGVPIKFVCAVTQNDIVARAITKGDYSMSDSVIPTLAPAMDIQVFFQDLTQIRTVSF